MSLLLASLPSLASARASEARAVMSLPAELSSFGPERKNTPPSSVSRSLSLSLSRLLVCPPPQSLTLLAKPTTIVTNTIPPPCYALDQSNGPGIIVPASTLRARTVSSGDRRKEDRALACFACVLLSLFFTLSLSLSLSLSSQRVRVCVRACNGMLCLCRSFLLPPPCSRQPARVFESTGEHVLAEWVQFAVVRRCWDVCIQVSST